MIITGEFSAAAPPAEVWNVLLDPDQLCPLLPNCQGARQIGENRFEGELAVKVKLMTIHGRVEGEILEMHRPFHIVVALVGDVLGMKGAARAQATFYFSEVGRTTHCRYVFDTALFGRLALLEEALVRSTAEKLASRFAANVTARFSRTDQPLQSETA